MIIIDPPSLQRGSFDTTEDCILLSCLNSPELESEFILNMIKEWTPGFEFVKRLDNVKEFASADENTSLKNLVFKINTIMR